MTDGNVSARAALGGAGERLAAGWLEARGYRVLARNWRCVYGELDLIAEEADELVFVEVKTRRGVAHGVPEEASHVPAALQQCVYRRTGWRVPALSSRR